MKVLRHVVLSIGQSKFVFLVGGAGAFLSLFLIAPHAGNQKEALLIFLVFFALSAIIGLVLVKISGVSRKDVSERREEIANKAASDFKSMSRQRKALAVAAAAVVVLVLIGGQLYSFFE